MKALLITLLATAGVFAGNISPASASTWWPGAHPPCRHRHWHVNQFHALTGSPRPTALRMRTRTCAPLWAPPQVSIPGQTS